MKTFHEFLTEGADIYCPNCGENHGKASEYHSPKVTFCGTCGYSAKKEQEQKSAAADKAIGYHLHQGISDKKTADDIAKQAKEKGATDIKVSSYPDPSSFSRFPDMKHSVGYHGVRSQKVDHWSHVGFMKK